MFLIQMDMKIQHVVPPFAHHLLFEAVECMAKSTRHHHLTQRLMVFFHILFYFFGYNY
jgi:hypothetical protein